MAVPKYRSARGRRLEWVRRLLLEGVPEWKIRQKFADGLNIAPKGKPPEFIKVSGATISADLKIIGDEWRAMHNDPEVGERVAGAVLERLTRVALKAEAAGKWSNAIRANALIMRYLGIRHERWKEQKDPQRVEISGPGGSPIPVAAIGLDMSQLADHELQHIIDADSDSLAGLLQVVEVKEGNG